MNNKVNVIIFLILVAFLFMLNTAVLADNDQEERHEQRRNSNYEIEDERSWQRESENEEENEENTGENLGSEFAEDLGAPSLILGGFTISILGLRLANQYIFQNKSNFLRKIRRPLSKIHPYLGFLMAAIGLVHGYFLIDESSFACVLVCTTLALIILTPLIGKSLRIRKWLVIHRFCTYLLIISLLIHVSVAD
ncbi:MAG: hypothetical protein ACOYVK_03335 [Bacillota bacterium]|jgi:hypothetical protein|uniref:hypothetical protein n=1 Tax=Desulfitibacter alkalitolerans TaxID=264641 RepID=UPI0004879553|nr:hypothetical protein [Desulfitibacter alkalitolerans]